MFNHILNEHLDRFALNFDWGTLRLNRLTLTVKTPGKPGFPSCLKKLPQISKDLWI